MKSASPLCGVIMCQPEHKAAIHSLAGTVPFDLSLEKIQIYIYFLKRPIFDSLWGEETTLSSLSYLSLLNWKMNHCDAPM